MAVAMGQKGEDPDANGRYNVPWPYRGLPEAGGDKVAPKSKLVIMRALQAPLPG